MKVNISPAPLSGAVNAVPSKSDAHRLMICAALADRTTTIRVPESSEDVEAMVRCLTALGAEIKYESGAYTVRPIGQLPASPALDCGESGSTLRFLLPVAAALGCNASFSGHGRLPERPISDLIDAMKAHGAAFSAGKLPFTVSGRLSGGDFYLPGNVSSQYVTGLMLALPLTREGGSVRLTAPLESAGYVNMTVSAMKRFGVETEPVPGGWHIKRQSYISPGIMSTDGDWTNAAPFLVSGAIGSGVTVTGLDMQSTQGDRAIVDILRRFGAEVTVSETCVSVRRGTLHSCEIDLKDIPDLLPSLAVLASFSEGETRFYNGSRLRLKESDRLRSVTDMINALGGSAGETRDGVTVRGKPPVGGAVSACGDHRIAMAAAIAAAYSADAVVIDGAEAVNKSYPRFFDDFKELGGMCDVI